MAKYKLTNEGVQYKETGACIPANPANRDWRKYQEWLKVKSNKPDPEFTEEELTTQKQRQIRQIENAIVAMRIRKDAAESEEFTELEAESQAELDELRTELIAEQEGD